MRSRTVVKNFLLDCTGITYHKWKAISEGVFIFNYHRVGDATKTLFDPNEFSCNEERFEQHLKFYKQHFDMLHMNELSDVINKGLKGKFGLITFDDGYIDNYTIAFPRLKSENLSAAFFVPTDYVESHLIPWWDEIAFMVRVAGVSQIKIAGKFIRLNPQAALRTVRLVLNQFKKDTRPVTHKLLAYRKLLQPTSEMPNEQLFMSWAQLSEMHQAGMTIGSHTCSHNILSHLPEDHQLKELTESKALLEQKLGKPVKTIAYPVGRANCYNETTCYLAQQSGYEFAFTFTDKLNRLDTLHPFAISRMGIDENMPTTAIRRKLAFLDWV